MPSKTPFWWREPAEVLRRKKYMERWSAENADLKKAAYEEWREKNGDYDRERCLKWQRNNPEKTRANISRYKAAKLRRVPAWADQSEIEKFYTAARAMTAASGIEHEVDHIIPLQGRLVCGLHVQNNLQVLPAAMNRSKGNRHA